MDRGMILDRENFRRMTLNNSQENICAMMTI